MPSLLTLGEIGEVRGFLASSEKLCGVGDNPCVAVETGSRYYTLIRFGEVWLIGRCRWVQPVAELEAGIPQSSGRQQGLHAANVRDHRIELITQHLTVSVRLPQCPRHPHRRVAPDGGAFWSGEI